MIDKMKMLLKEFNPCLQMHKIDMRRLKISNLFKRQTESKSPLEVEQNLLLVANYLNTSLNCIRNNYDRSKSDLNTALDLLQPISTELNQTIEGFKDNIGSMVDLNSVQNAHIKFKRYVRNTLNESLHKTQFKKWMKEFKKFKRDQSEIISFDDVYGKTSKRKKKFDEYSESKSSGEWKSIERQQQKEEIKKEHPCKKMKTNNNNTNDIVIGETNNNINNTTNDIVIGDDEVKPKPKAVFVIDVDNDDTIYLD